MNNQLYNTMIDMLRKAIEKFHLEEESGKSGGDIFDAVKQNVSEVKKQLNKGIQIHDQILVMFKTGIYFYFIN